ncbi:MAG: hypothetical protein KDA42_18350 [Planctomycetales bacterium]|nr:hypothetical protein [Planctomycetales bacterium]
MRISAYRALRDIVGLTDDEIDRAFRIKSVKVGAKSVNQQQSQIDVKVGTKIQALRTNLEVVNAHLDHITRLDDQAARSKVKAR